MDARVSCSPVAGICESASSEVGSMENATDISSILAVSQGLLNPSTALQSIVTVSRNKTSKHQRDFWLKICMASDLLRQWVLCCPGTNKFRQ